MLLWWWSLVPGVGAFDSSLWEYENHTEVKRKSSILSIFNDSSVGDGLEDIQEEDEDEDADKKDEIKAEDVSEEQLVLPQVGNILSHEGIDVRLGWNEENEGTNEARFQNHDTESIKSHFVPNLGKIKEQWPGEECDAYNFGSNHEVLDQIQQNVENTQNSMTVEYQDNCYHRLNEDSGRNSVYPQILKISLKSMGCNLSLGFLEGETQGIFGLGPLRCNELQLLPNIYFFDDI